MSDGKQYIKVKFQEGPIKEAGVNGCQVDDVILFLTRRLKELNQPPHQCIENTQAIQHLFGAFNALDRRTSGRVTRGVEGTSAV